MRLSNKIVLATLNRHKFEEFQALLKGYPELELVPVDQFIRNPRGIGKVEHFSTYQENALAKARVVNQGCHYPTLADDSGLEVEALGWKPGVFSHRYAPAQLNISQDQANVELLLSELKGAKTRNARFQCTLAMIIEGILIHATGTLEGTICDAPRGNMGFGYDSVFLPTGKTKTLAEMSGTEKNQISHRAQALHQLMSQVKSHEIIFAKP